MNKKVMRIGISMRVTQAQGYAEERDSLAGDWRRFLPMVLPEVHWIGLPNLGEDITAYVQDWGVEALILSGGDSIGEAPIRDTTETALLDIALRDSLPVLGVCRGLQMIQHFFGGNIQSCSAKDHVAIRHGIRMTQAGEAAFGVREMEVNSFHKQGVSRDTLAPGLECLAYADGAGTEGDWVEALRHERSSILGVMWHPEREPEPTPSDRHMVRALFGYESETP